MALLVVLFIIVPIAELAVIIQVGQSVGVLATILLLIVVSVVGAWLVKFQGLNVLLRAKAKADSGEMPGDELIAGIAILFAGALMLTPGFITDAVGLALLIPPIRLVLIAFVRRRFRGRMDTFTSRPFEVDGWEAE